jgi:hypothetical protein
MKRLRYTLLADGSSDQALMPVIDWLLGQKLPAWRIVPQFARLGAVGLALAQRVPAALMMFPCDLLFVHRDAEGVPATQRLREIAEAMCCYDQRYVPVVPVRMTEAWLLSDERAIRRAAGNQRGSHQLGLPERRRWEGRPDPKTDLARALRAASGKTKRRQSRDEFSRQRILVAEYTEDFSSLRGLASFDELELQLAEKLKDL